LPYVSLETVLWIVALVFTVGGFAGLVLPGLPGAPLLFLGLLSAAWAEDFVHVGWRTLVLIGVMGALTYVVDLAAAALGAEAFGGSKRALLGAGIGAFVGLFFGIPGILLGPFLGALIAELTMKQNLRKASMAGVGAMLGFLVGTAAKFALAAGMVAVFLLVRFL